MDLDGRRSTVDEVVGSAVVIGLDLWMVVLLLEVHKRDRFEAQA